MNQGADQSTQKIVMDGNFDFPGPRGSAKWGAARHAGFQSIPDVLFIKQQALGLDPVDLVVLLNLTLFWWFRDQPPFPRSNIIAQRMGVSARTVQRALKKLERLGYIRRGHWQDDEGNVRPALYLDGLLDALAKVATLDPILSKRMENAAALPPG
jgi:helix-turn-helix protein